MSLFQDNFNILLIGFIFSFLVFFILWLIQVIKKDAGWVDVGWSSSLSILVIVISIFADGLVLRRILVSSFLLFWAIRLITYIIKDRILSDEEDSRYKNLRNYWGEKANKKFFVFFTFQSFLVLLFAIPFLPIFNNSLPFNLFDIIGISIWLLAITGECLSDLQLYNFRNKPENKLKVCKVGFWNYSRHPNYFFEWLQWIAFVFFSFGSEYFYISFIGPIFMYLFLTKISGVYWVEMQAVKKRGAEYIKYQSEVPMFFPKLKR